MSQINWNVFGRIKQWLCSRRNKQAIINPFLYKYKQPKVSQLKTVIIIDSDNSDTEMEENKNKMRKSSCREQGQDNNNNINNNQNNNNNIKNINNQVKRSQHRISQFSDKQFKQLNKLQNQDDYHAYYLQLLINKQVQIDLQIRQKQNLAAKLRQLFIRNKQSQQYFWKSLYHYPKQTLSYSDSQILSRCEQYDQLQESKLHKQYQRDVEYIRQFKYSYQINDYPEITFEEYKKIRKLWYQANSKKSNQVIININLKILQKLTYRSFRTLSYGTWLNDEIINGYLQMLQNKSVQNKKQSKYKILNSFFAQTTFSKSPQMINRALKRKNITTQHKIIIAINNGNHWLFTYVNQGKIIIYDSICKYNVQNYLLSQSTGDIIRNIMKFTQIFYGYQYKLEMDQQYPQQRNSFDCGMFLLCGIKDIIIGKNQWSFSQDDIKYKRVQIANQILTQNITGFTQW